MAEIETFDEYVERQVRRILGTIDDQIKKEFGRRLDPRRDSGFFKWYTGETDEFGFPRTLTYRVLSSDELHHSVKGLRHLQKTSSLSEKEIEEIFSYSPALKSFYDNNKKNWRLGYDGFNETVEGKDLRDDVLKAYKVDAIFRKVLGFPSDNHGTYIFGHNDKAHSNFIDLAEKRFSSDGEYEVEISQDPRPALCIRRPSCINEPDSPGFGGLYHPQHYTNCNWSKNRFLARWHGDAISTAEFTLKILDICKELGYSAHAELWLSGNSLGGVFYDPSINSS